MRGLFALLPVLAACAADASLVVTTVYRNATDGGSCQCDVRSSSYDFNPVSAAGLSTGTVSTATTLQGQAINVTIAALYGGQDLSAYTTLAGDGSNGQGNKAFVSSLTYMYNNVQNWFGISIHGAFGADPPQKGSGGIAIDYEVANHGFLSKGPALAPEATIDVKTDLTTITQTSTTSVTINEGRPSSLTSSGQKGSLALSTADSATSTMSVMQGTAFENFSSTIANTAITNSVATGTVSATSVLVTTSTTSSSGGPISTSGQNLASTSTNVAPTATNPASGQFVVLVSNGHQFGCQNDSLILLPMGQNGQAVWIGADGVLSCNQDTAYIIPRSGMQRRGIAGRAFSNSTSYFEIALGRSVPSEATTKGFSFSEGILHLVVGSNELGFVLFGTVLEAYDTSLGIPSGGISIVVGGQSPTISATDSGTISASSRSASLSTTLSFTDVRSTSAKIDKTSSAPSTMSKIVSTTASIDATISASTSSFRVGMSTSGLDSERIPTSSVMVMSSDISALPYMGSSSSLLAFSTTVVASTSTSMSLVPAPSSDLTSVVGEVSLTSFAAIFSMSTDATSISTAASSTSSEADFYPTWTATASSSSTAPSASIVTPEIIQGCSLATNKNVFAHMIIGNLYNYKTEDYYNDFKLAASYGIDAMALNVGRDSWELNSVALAYEAAAQLYTSETTCFKVFVSLDMSSFNKDYAPDGSYVMPYVTNFKSHPAQYFYNNKHFVSTYAGYQQFDWVTTFVSPLAQQGIDIYFVPAYSVNTYAAAAYATPESDGQYLWNAWPNDAATGQPTNTTISPALAEEYISNKGSKSLMLNISPWFFTHFSNDVKNMYFRSEGLWQQRWTQMINELRAGTDLLQITSWNDFGESHYLGPIGSKEPDALYPEDSNGVSSLEWVEVDDHSPGGASNPQYLDHSAFADQAIAWIEAFKTGTFPTIVPFSGQLTGASSSDSAALGAYQSNINSDRMYVSYRLQYNDSMTLEDLSREPVGSAYGQNAIVIDTYLSTSGTVYVAWPALSDTDGTVLQAASQDSMDIPAGASQTFASFVDPQLHTRRYGQPQVSLATGGGSYALQMDELLPIMTPQLAAQTNINFNAYTKKFTRFSSLISAK